MNDHPFHTPETNAPRTITEPSFRQPGIAYYTPETWTVRKDTMYAARAAIECGLEHTRSALIEHDSNLGRTTQKNKWWAEQIEEHIRQMEKALADVINNPT